MDFAQWPDEALRPAFGEALAVVKSMGAQMLEIENPGFSIRPDYRLRD